MESTEKASYPLWINQLSSREENQKQVPKLLKLPRHYFALDHAMIQRNSTTGPVLYSCNHAIKFFINERYREGIHYVWCSEFFDSRWILTLMGRIPKSSNPAQIYMDMEEAVDPFDYHDYKIADQRSKLLIQAQRWLDDGEITDQNFKEIAVLAKRSDWDLWRPLLYVIPRTELINQRLEHVPPEERANIGMEYRIKELHHNEFDVVAFDRRRR